MPAITWPAVTVVRTAAGTRVRWTEPLVTACLAAHNEGATYAEIAEHYGVPLTSLTTALCSGLQRHHVPPDPRHLPCGCGVGRRCETAELLARAYQALPVGSREWAVARQRYLAHVAGQEGE